MSLAASFKNITQIQTLTDDQEKSVESLVEEYTRRLTAANLSTLRENSLALTSACQLIALGELGLYTDEESFFKKSTMGDLESFRHLVNRIRGALGQTTTHKNNDEIRSQSFSPEQSASILADYAQVKRRSGMSPQGNNRNNISPLRIPTTNTTAYQRIMDEKQRSDEQRAKMQERDLSPICVHFSPIHKSKDMVVKKDEIIEQIEEKDDNQTIDKQSPQKRKRKYDDDIIEDDNDESEEILDNNIKVDGNNFIDDKQRKRKRYDEQPDQINTQPNNSILQQKLSQINSAQNEENKQQHKDGNNQLKSSNHIDPSRGKVKAKGKAKKTSAASASLAKRKSKEQKQQNTPVSSQESNASQESYSEWRARMLQRYKKNPD
ncbi:MAG: hypothetical protein EZS28_000283 [Streblomastix strix]|uniref:Uncharacterized protein n=1 Tax=Streblomastix strix TaxID=222440 RepID=A0A5J4XAQ1_9EUKA|nr:MAG: hypothetical protein EZS28_000283 [Streblomastix strix]